MNNQQLIESLQYHTDRLYEEESKKDIGKKVAAGVLGAGALAIRDRDNQIKTARLAAKYSDNLAYGRHLHSTSGEVLKGLPHKLKNVANKAKLVTLKTIKKHPKGAAIGAGIGAAAIGAKKAYDHFKNKKK